jgi:glutathione S-transferase
MLKTESVPLLTREMDRELGQRHFVAGDVFSIADITLLCVLDFGAGPVHVSCVPFLCSRETSFPRFSAHFL